MCAEVSSDPQNPRLRQAEVTIRAEDPSAKDFKWREILSEFLDSTVYYVEYTSVDAKPEDSFYYVRLDARGDVKLYDDGINIIEGLQTMLEKRRSFLQRLGDFTFFDFMAALIGMTVTVTFVYLIIWQPEQGKDFGSVFGIVAGYYFGKNVASK